MSAQNTPHCIPPETAPLLEVAGLDVCFDEDSGSVSVLRDVHFCVRPGETLCFVGESGCGKSMTALSLLRLTPPGSRLTGGSLRLEGVELTTLDETAMRGLRGSRMAMIFQEPMTSLNPVLRIGDQVAEPLIRHLGLSRTEAARAAVAALRQVGIPGAEDRVLDYPHQMSGGMRQRVAIAMALGCSPRLLLADEPTTALDVTIQGQILALLNEQTRGRGMGLLLITHDLGVVAETADRVGVMYAGQIVEAAPVADLFAEPLHPYTIGLMGAMPNRHAARGARLATIAGTVPAPGHLPPGCAFAPRCMQVMARCATPPPEHVLPARQGHAARSVRCWLHATQDNCENGHSQRYGA